MPNAFRMRAIRRRWRPGWIAAATAVAAAVAVLWLSGLPAAAQSTLYRAPRLPGTSNPDLSGIWQAFVTANWNLEDHGAEAGEFPRLLGIWGAQPPGQSVVVGGRIPYRPEALAKREENAGNRLTVDPDNINTVGDPEAKCYMPGVPRATYMPFPFQIIQSTDRIVIAYQFANANRTIPIGGTMPSPVDFWMGWSNAHWEGDTLVVEVTGFHDLSWFDRAGNHHSAGLRVIERYTPISPFHMQYEATIEDEAVFTRPWTIRFPLYRRIEENVRLLEFKCVDLAEEYVYGGLADEPAR